MTVENPKDITLNLPPLEETGDPEFEVNWLNWRNWLAFLIILPLYGVAVWLVMVKNKWLVRQIMDMFDANSERGYIDYWF